MTWMTYQRNGAIGLTRVRLSRGRRRVLLALLSGADNLHSWRLCQVAQVGPGTLHPFLAHLEDASWVTREARPVDHQRTPCYDLTGTGRLQAASALRLTY